MKIPIKQTAHFSHVLDFFFQQKPGGMHPDIRVCCLGQTRSPALLAVFSGDTGTALSPRALTHSLEETGGALIASGFAG